MAEAGSEPKHPGCRAQHLPAVYTTCWESWCDERLEAGRVGGMGEVARDLRVLKCVLKLIEFREVGKEVISLEADRDLRVGRLKNGFRWNWVK